MSITSGYKFTNSTSSTHDVTPLVLGLTTNYALTKDTASEAGLNNKTAPIDAQEIITFRSRDIAKVNTGLNIQNPAKVKSGIQYGVQVEETLVTEDSGDPSFRIDDPVVVSINVRHPKSGYITNTHVATAVLRAVSSLLRSDGTWRFDDLMRSAERPVAD
jgi:hypothetical protein